MRQQKHRAFSCLFSFFLSLVFISVCLFTAVWLRQGSALSAQLMSYPPTPASSTVQTASLPESLNSHCALLLRLSDGKVLMAKNSGEKAYPASLTKIMTVLVALEDLSGKEDTFTLPEDIFPPLYSEGASMAGFLPCETVRTKDLLYGALLPSGADAAVALAYRVSGSESAFVEKMNQKARELGMDHTYYKNATGLHQEGHVTTADDLSLLLQYALNNAEFREIFTSARHTVPPTNLHPEGFTFYSTLSESLEGVEIPDGDILGGKTGYTPEAGLCLASLAEVGGTEYLLITMGAPANHQTEPYHITDAVSVYQRLPNG